MSHEHELPDDGFSPSNWNNFGAYDADFESWESEFDDPERLARLTERIAELAVTEVVYVTAGEIPMSPEVLMANQLATEVQNAHPEGRGDREIGGATQIIEKPHVEPRYLVEKASPRDGESFDLAGEDMRQAALGFIYLTTGMSVDDY